MMFIGQSLYSGNGDDAPNKFASISSCSQLIVSLLLLFEWDDSDAGKSCSRVEFNGISSDDSADE